MPEVMKRLSLAQQIDKILRKDSKVFISDVGFIVCIYTGQLSFPILIHSTSFFMLKLTLTWLYSNIMCGRVSINSHIIADFNYILFL